MARNEHGGTVWDVVVSPDAGDNDAVKVLPNTPVPWYDVNGVEQDDFLLWSPIDNDFTIAATEITSTADGFLPRFLSPDGVTLYDGAGNLLPKRGGGGTGGGASTWDELSDKPTYIAAGSTQANARAEIGAAAASDVSTLTTTVAGKLDADDLESEVEAYLDASGRPQIVVIGEGDPVPAVPSGSLVIRVAGAATGGLSISQVLAESIGAVSAGGTGTTSATPAALGADAFCLALISGYQSGATSGDPAPLPTSFTAMGLTWTAVSLPNDNNSNGLNVARLYKGTGTGTATKPVVGFAEAMTQVHIRIVQVVNGAGVVVQATSAQNTGGNGSPSATLPSAISGTGVVLTWIVQNNNTNTQTPGTGFTEIGSALSATGVRTSGAYAIPGSQTASWTTPTSPSQYQKLVIVAEVR